MLSLYALRMLSAELSVPFCMNAPLHGNACAGVVGFVGGESCMRGRGVRAVKNWSVFFQAEDGIRDAQGSRGLGDVNKRQV